MKPEDASISLKEYFNTKILNIEKNTELARLAIERRLESMNEFRDQLRDQAGQFMTREYYEVRHKELTSKVDELIVNRAVLDEKASTGAVNRSLIISLVGVLLSIISIVVGVVVKLAK